jgi:hypothetical protein
LKANHYRFVHRLVQAVDGPAHFYLQTLCARDLDPYGPDQGFYFGLGRHGVPPGKDMNPKATAVVDNGEGELMPNGAMKMLSCSLDAASPGKSFMQLRGQKSLQGLRRRRAQS